MLSSDTEDIDKAVRSTQRDILLLSLFALVVTLLLSIYLASTIARPIRLLARSSERLAGGYGRKVQIPDLSRRRDEIGDLSVSLRQMTSALWARMDAIERFAADVAHEIKNPLSSLRSAIETIDRTDDPATQKKLMSILVEDVKRIDRLISDISAASRLDSELSRAETQPIELVAMLAALIDMENMVTKREGVTLKLNAESGVNVLGVEGQIAQVFRNLIDNAMSFSPADGIVEITVRTDDQWATVTVEDQGPGLPPGKTEAIFDRFYTQRPSNEKFGTHSGLGLSISKQIIEAHKGTITAENIYADGDMAGPSGTRLIVRLPLSR